MVLNKAGLNSAPAPQTEHDESEMDALVWFQTDIRNAYIQSPNDAPLIFIVKNGQGINPHLTLFYKYCSKMTVNLDLSIDKQAANQRALFQTLSRVVRLRQRAPHAQT